MASPKISKTNGGIYSWTRLSRDSLLDMRICDLNLNLNTGQLPARIQQLYRELSRKYIAFQPHFWLSDEWFCPDGVPGIAIPFYLAHPRLQRLEQEFMMEVEGGDKIWCMKLLRHETGHALLNAYKLDQRRDWRRHFGRPGSRYPDSYLPEPYSKEFAINLPDWYAQSHPHEDWAETFAVWLNPNSDWKLRYRSWPALKKLQYVDSLMTEISEHRPRLRNQRTHYPVQKIRTTLRSYYEDKTCRYGEDSPEFFDSDLRKLFEDKTAAPKANKASRSIRAMRGELVAIVGRWSGEHKYRINLVLRDMIKRCDQLDLRATRSQDDMLPELAACVTMLVMNKLYSGGFHYAL